jgi:hypothetical protein
MKNALWLVGLVLAAPAAAQPAAPPLELNLSCRGESTGLATVGTESVSTRSNWGGASTSYGTRQGLVTIDTLISFRLSGGEAMLSVPAALLPPIHGGKSGEFRVRELQIGERDITGKIRINLMNNASFRIDRISGRLTSSGGFQGDCEAEDVARRKF